MEKLKITKKEWLVRSALEPPPCPAWKRSCRTCSSGLTGRCTTKNVVYQVTTWSVPVLVDPVRVISAKLSSALDTYCFDEHFRDSANCMQNTPIIDPMITSHPNEPESRLSVTILRRCRDSADRKIAEALAICDTQPKMNNQIDTWSMSGEA